MAKASRVAVVTGASSGIGKEAAKALAGQGWHVIALGRDPGRTTSAAEEIRAASQGGEVDVIQADLSRMADAVRAVDQIVALTDKVHVLINNAGGMTKSFVVTPEGLEENFAGNHLGPFLLTNRLLPLIREAAAGAPRGSVRIINTSSDGGEMIPGLKWDDLQLLEGFDPGRAYCQGKLANVMFARGLAARLADDGVVAHAVHPGTIDSNFINHVGESTRAYMSTLTMMSPEEGAKALVWLATGEEPGQTTGGYYHQHKPMPANPFADDETNNDRLWAESERLVATATA